MRYNNVIKWKGDILSSTTDADEETIHERQAEIQGKPTYLVFFFFLIDKSSMCKHYLFLCGEEKKKGRTCGSEGYLKKY